MALPHLLLVDDSEVVLAFARASLAGHYQLSTASNGVEAMQKLPQLMPAAVLLDLSMPEMPGDEVLARMQRDPQLRPIPVIIVSSERARAEACLKAGARAFLAKPVTAQDLRATVDRVLQDAQRREREGGVAALVLSVGPHQLAVPLESVVSVMHMPALRPLPFGPHYLCELLELHGDTVPVLDLARRLGVEHAQPLDERRLVVIRHGDRRLALGVDAVRDPEELPPSAFTPSDKVGGAEHGALGRALRGLLRMNDTVAPLLDPEALVSRELLSVVVDTLRKEPGA